MLCTFTAGVTNGAPSSLKAQSSTWSEVAIACGMHAAEVVRDEEESEGERGHLGVVGSVEMYGIGEQVWNRGYWKVG